MKNPLVKIIIASVFLSSCLVQSPKYSTLEQVVSLKLGMPKAEVEEKLGIEPYNLKAYTDTSSVFIYVYRVLERTTLYLDTHTINGKQVTGKYLQLEVGYSKDNKVISIESCNYCPDNLVSTSKIDFEKVLAFFTVTIPVILIYIGVKN